MNPAENHVALLGGLRRQGGWRVARTVRHVAVIGGADLDLSQAQLDGKDVSIVKVSLIGGVELKLPADIDVDLRAFSAVGGVSISVPTGTRVVVSSFSLVGSRSDKGRAEDADTTAVVRIRNFSLVGGVTVDHY